MLYTENETNLHLIDPKYFVLKMDCVKLSFFSVTSKENCKESTALALKPVRLHPFFQPTREKSRANDLKIA